MNELNEFQLIAIGFISYPIVKFMALAIFDRSVKSIDDQAKKELVNDRTNR